MIKKAALTCVSVLIPLLAGASTLDLYRDLVGKTLLVAPALPKATDLVLSDLPTDRTNAIAAIEAELAKGGIEVVPDGPHFVRLLPLNWRDTFLKDAPLRGSELQSSKDQEILAAGILDFPEATLSQVLSVYADLSRRTILRPCDLPAPMFQFKTVCPLTREEVVYALNTVLAFNGIAMVNDGASFVQAVPMARRVQVKAQAPTRDPKERLFDPKKFPTVGRRDLPAPASKLESELERLEATLYQLLYHRGSPLRPAFRLLELEAQLTQKTAVASQFDGTGVWFHVQTPLSQSELIYAVETTLKLNNLAIIPVDDRGIRLGHINELGVQSRQ